MKIRLHQPLRLLVTFLLLGGAQAQNAPPSPAPPTLNTPAPNPAAPTTLTPTTLTDVLTWLRAAPGWQAADYAYRAAELQVQAARIRAGVSLSAGGTLSATKIPWDSAEWAGSSSVNVSLSASVMPWSPAREALRSAERGLQAAAIELRRTRADLSVQAVQAYGGARQAAAGLGLARAGRELAAQAYEVAQSQRASGVIPVETLLERQTALQNAEAAQAQAERGLTLATNQLRRLLNREFSVPTDPAAFTPLTFSVANPDEGALINRALSARPEVARAGASVQDALANVQAAELDARLPDLSAAAQFGQLGTTDSTGGKRVSGNFNLKSGVAGVQATWPLSDTSKLPTGAVLSLTANVPLLGRTQGTALEQARLGLSQAELALEQARQSVTLDVRTRLSEYLDEQGGLSALQTALTRAQTVLDAARARQEAGTGTALELRQAELSLAQAQNNLQTAQQRISIAALNLMQATGELDPFLLATLPTNATPATGDRP